MFRSYLKLICFLLLGQLYGQVSFIVQTDARQSLVGSPFNIEFRLNNAEGSNFQEPDFGGLKKLGGPSRSMSTTIINGSMSSSIGYVYAVVGTKAGKYSIGPAKIVVGGKVLKTNPISIEIINNNSSSKHSGEKGDVFVRLSVDRQEAYVGQQVIVTYKLYTQIGIDRVEAIKNDLPAHCEVEFFATEYPAEREIIKGQQYTSKILNQYALYPTLSGRLDLVPRSYRLLMSEEDPFGINMNSMFFNSAKVIESNAESIKVLELPPPKPDNFSGAVGKFEVKFSKLNPTYNLSDAINIQLSIQGNGNFNHLNPKIHLQDTAFDFLDPSSTPPIKITEELQLIKSQTFDFLLTPKSSGTFNFNPSFCYFDPDLKKYFQATDSFSILIKNSLVKQTTVESEMRPLHYNNTLVVNNVWNNYLPLLLFIFPFVFGLILFWNQWINKFPLLNKFLSPSSKTNNKVELNENDLESRIIYTVKNLFPESKECSNLYQIKEFLSQQKFSSNAIKLLEVINQYQILKYQPGSNGQEFEEIKNSLLKITD